MKNLEKIAINDKKIRDLNRGENIKSRIKNRLDKYCPYIPAIIAIAAIMYYVSCNTQALK